MTLSNPQNATVADGEATGTIIEDDGLPSLRIDDVTVAEISGAVAEFTVRLSAASGQAVTVEYATTDGTAVVGADYTETNGTLTIPVGAVAGTIRVPVHDDALDEPDETFTVTLSNPQNATVADGEATGTITDNDHPAITASFGAMSYTVTEGESIDVTVILSAPPGRSVVVPLTHTPGNGATETDYSGIPVSVRFHLSETHQTFVVMAVADAEYDDGESVALGFGVLPSGVTETDPEVATVTIDDNNQVSGVVAREWLARFGRTATADVVDALDERMRWLTEPPRCARPGGTFPDRYPRWRCRPPHDKESPSVVLGGYRFDSDAEPASASGQN